MTKTFSIGELTFPGVLHDSGIEISAEKKSAFDTSLTNSLDLTNGADLDNNHYNIIILGERSFQGCSFSSVIVPSTVKEIKSYCFFSSKIESVIIKSTKCSIGGASFESAAIKHIDLSNVGVTEFGGQTFWNSKLSSIFLPKNLKTLKWHDFANCRNLYSITFPPTLESIQKYAFANTSIRTLDFSKSQNIAFNNESLIQMNNLVEIYLPYCISRRSNINNLVLANQNIIYHHGLRTLTDVKSQSFARCAFQVSCKCRHNSKVQIIHAFIAIALS